MEPVKEDEKKQLMREEENWESVVGWEPTCRNCFKEDESDTVKKGSEMRVKLILT